MLQDGRYEKLIRLDSRVMMYYMGGESTSYLRCIKNLTTKLSFYFIRSVALRAELRPCQFVYKCN